MTKEKLKEINEKIIGLFPTLNQIYEYYDNQSDVEEVINTLEEISDAIDKDLQDADMDN